MPRKRIMASDYASIYALASGDTELQIYGDIGNNWWNEESITAKSVADALSGIKGGTLTVRVNSYGGVVSDGLAIYNAIRRANVAKRIVEIDGVAMSAASLIAMAGDTVRMSANALLMIHGPWTSVDGNAQHMRDAADTLDKYAAAMSTGYVRNGITQEDALALLTDGVDHYYTAADAKAAGFIDEISGNSSVTNARASLAIRASAMARYRIPAPSAGAHCEVNEMADKATDTPADDNPVPASTPPTPTDADIQARARDMIAAHGRALDEAFGQLLAMPNYPHAALLRDRVQAARSDLSQTPDSIRAALLADIGRQHSEPMHGASYTRATIGEDQRDKAKAGIGAVVLARMGGPQVDRGNEYRGRALHEIAAACLREVGIRTEGLTRSEIASKVFASHSTSDFPGILMDAANKRLQAAYTAWPQTWRSIAAVSAVSDFKPVNLVRIGAFTTLAVIPEGSEYKQGTIGEEKETAQAETKGRFIQFTRQMIINDDLGAFARIPQIMGQAAARTLNADVWGVLNSNPTMSDTKALFVSDHGNLAGSNGAISVATLSAGRLAMRIQKAPNAAAGEYLNIMPRYLACPVTKEDLARQVVQSTENIDTTASRARNPIRDWGPLEVISDPTLDGTSTTAWYLLADPALVPVIEVVFLDGNEAPYLESEMEFLTDAVRSKVRLDYGVAANDWRGGYKNAGA